jgi:hypothetical protein
MLTFHPARAQGRHNKIFLLMEGPPAAHQNASAAAHAQSQKELAEDKFATGTALHPDPLKTRSNATYFWYSRRDHPRRG